MTMMTEKQIQEEITKLERKILEKLRSGKTDFRTESVEMRTYKKVLGEVY